MGYKKDAKAKDLTEMRKLIEDRDCQVCKKNKANIRYTFYSKHPSNDRAYYLEYVCSLKCGIERIESIYDLYERYYGGLWRSGRK